MLQQRTGLLSGGLLADKAANVLCEVEGIRFGK
jgi:hypothetical protein